MKKGKVVVAMSGGVDSSLTAALLKDEGYEVIGATMRLSEQTRDSCDNDRGCCSLKSIEDARRVSDIIGIRHYVLDFQEMFQKKVINYFLQSYEMGETPNPCIACNRYIKFEGLLEKAIDLGADFLATGHYARIEYMQERYFLKKGIDLSKDQSYVLYHLNQEMLSHFLLPLGTYTKKQTRKLAEEYDLPVAHKPDSQEICFVPDDDYKSYLRQEIPEALHPGDICDMKGNVIGRHNGLPFYTIGQRKGLGVTAEQPLYVIKIDHENNRLIVGHDTDTLSEGFYAIDLNWISGDRIEHRTHLQAKIRYGKKESPAWVIPLDDERIRVEFDGPQRAVTPGQSVVFYDDDIVVGGGKIIAQP